MKNKNIIFGVVGIIVLFVVGFVIVNSGRKSQLSTNDQSSNKQEAGNQLATVDSITHAHGLSVDVVDASKVYVATHHGLLVLQNDKELNRVGVAQDDYMGFSAHPTDSKVFFSSGHPENGGNIGFQKSEDGGVTWVKISDGIQGPVDFHAMTISPVNPNLIYGWYRGMLQRSPDQGKTWEIATTTSYPIVNLAADTKDENKVFAATPQGLMISTNRGTEWSTLFEGFVSVVAINPLDSQKLLSFSEKYGLAKSSAGGKNWEKLKETFSGETPLFIAFSKQNPEIVYSLTEKNSIYKSSDSGDSWKKIR